jgi:transposase-like protein
MEQNVVNCPHCGKIISKDALNGKKQTEVKCPQCNNGKCFKDGFRQTNHGKIQRYLCTKCGYRFS